MIVYNIPPPHIFTFIGMKCSIFFKQTNHEKTEMVVKDLEKTSPYIHLCSKAGCTGTQSHSHTHGLFNGYILHTHQIMLML